MRLTLSTVLVTTLAAVGCAGSAGEDADSAAAAASEATTAPSAGDAAYEGALTKLRQFKIAGVFTGKHTEQFDEDGNNVIAETTARLSLSEEKVCSEDGRFCGPKYELLVTYHLVKDVQRAEGDVQKIETKRDVASEGYIGFGHTLLLGNDRVAFVPVKSASPAYTHFWIETNEFGGVRFEDPQRAEVPSWAFGARPEFYPSDKIILRRE